jgi:hypothetical protein
MVVAAQRRLANNPNETGRNRMCFMLYLHQGESGVKRRWKSFEALSFSIFRIPYYIFHLSLKKISSGNGK